MDATIIRLFQKELFSRFLPSTYPGHVGLAAAEPWSSMPKWKDGDTVELILFFVVKFVVLPIKVNILL